MEELPEYKGTVWGSRRSDTNLRLPLYGREEAHLGQRSVRPRRPPSLWLTSGRKILVMIADRKELQAEGES